MISVVLPVTQAEIAIWLAEQTIAGTATARLTRQLTKLGFKKSAAALGPIGLGAELGFAAGRELGKATANNISKGIPSTVGLDYTKEIALYEQSALRGNKII